MTSHACNSQLVSECILNCHIPDVTLSESTTDAQWFQTSYRETKHEAGLRDQRDECRDEPGVYI